MPPKLDDEVLWIDYNSFVALRMLERHVWWPSYKRYRNSV
jgi:hypothetical protein